MVQQLRTVEGKTLPLNNNRNTGSGFYLSCQITIDTIYGQREIGHSLVHFFPLFCSEKVRRITPTLRLENSRGLSQTVKMRLCNERHRAATGDLISMHHSRDEKHRGPQRHIWHVSNPNCPCCYAWADFKLPLGHAHFAEKHLELL